MRPELKAGLEGTGGHPGTGGSAGEDAFAGAGGSGGGRGGEPLLPVGTLLDGRYEILGLIGQGSFAAVYEARHQGLHSRHAVKVLHQEIARADESVRGRFLDEGRIQANLRHPHIVAVTEIVTDPLPGLVLEYVDGPNLYEYVAGLGRRLAVQEAVELMLPVVDAIATAHQQRVVHRDLKPENILVGKGAGGRPHPKVTDFGIAKALAESPFDSGKRRTRAGGKPMGTLLYLSPEQIRAPSHVDERTDVFALGAILYELVTGELAFDAETDFEVMSRIVNAGYRPPEELVPDLPPALAQCIRSALTVDPAQRIQSAEALRDLLRGAPQASGSSWQFAPAVAASTANATHAPPKRDVVKDATIQDFIEYAFAVCISVMSGSESSAKETLQAFENTYERPWIEAYGSSLLFHPPEVLRGGSFDQRSWVYYLTGLLYSLLAGRPPFTASNEHALRTAILSGRYPAPESLTQVPRGLAPVIETGLQADPALRFQSVEQFFTALGRPGLADGMEQRKAVHVRNEDGAQSESSLAGLWAGIAGFVFVLYLFSTC